MSTQSLIRSVQDYLDAQTYFDERGDSGEATELDASRVDWARLNVQEQISEPQERAAQELVAATQAYLSAEVSFQECRIGGEGCDQLNRRLQRARRNLQEQLKCAAHLGAACCAAQATAGTDRIRILVAIDDSAPAEWAVAVAGGLAQKLSGQVMLLHVVQPVALTGELAYVPEEVDRQHKQQGEALLEQARRILPKSVEADHMLREGHAATEIISAARVWEPHFIVIGTRGRGRLAQFLLGSTAEAVVRQAACPVVTVGHEPDSLVFRERDKAESKASLVAP